MVLMGNFAGEVSHTPELFEMLREHAVEPRVTLVENVLSQLQERGAVSDDIDKHTIATMCFGSYFGAFYRGDPKEDDPRERRRRACGRRSPPDGRHRSHAADRSGTFACRMSVTWTPGKTPAATPAGMG